MDVLGVLADIFRNALDERYDVMVGRLFDLADAVDRQVDIGKASAGYARYVDAVPRDKREFRNAQHPATPDRMRACSKRAWDGQVKVWRFALKQWEPAEDGAAAPRRITPEQIADTAPAASS